MSGNGSIGQMIHGAQQGGSAQGTPRSTQMPSGGGSAPQPNFQQSAPTQQLPQAGINALGSYAHQPAGQLPQGGGFFGANLQPVDSAANRNFALPASTQSPTTIAQQQAVFSGVPNSLTSPDLSSLAAYLSQGNRFSPGYNLVTGRNDGGQS